jgi:hypothetical protein
MSFLTICEMRWNVGKLATEPVGVTLLGAEELVDTGEY